MLHCLFFIYLQIDLIKMKSIFKFFIFFFIFILFFSCQKKDEKATWDLNIFTPLINTNLGIKNIITDSLIEVDSDSSLKLVYASSLYEFSVDSLVDIPDTIAFQSYSTPFNFTAIPGAQLINKTENKNLKLPGAELTKLIIKSGYINFKASSTVKEKIVCTYQIPSAKMNGNIISIREKIPPADANGPGVVTKKVDISGCTIILTGTNGADANILTNIYKIAIDSSANNIVITSKDNFKILANFEDLVFDYAKGYFGVQQIQSNLQSTSINLFKDIVGGAIQLEDIAFNLNIKNGFGVEASLCIKEFKSINSKTGNTVSLSGPIIGSLIHINRAKETYNAANPVIPSKTSVNFKQTNFNQLIENFPDRLDYSIDLNINPLGNISCGNDFMYFNQGVKANLEMEIPLSLNASKLTLTDTVDFKLSKPEDYQIEKGVLNLIADNGFPFAAKIQLYLIDENNTFIDSLIYSPNVINPGLTDENFIVISKSKSFIPIPISLEKMNSLYTAKKIIILIEFNTTAYPNYIKIYNHYNLDLKLTGDFKMMIN